MLHASTQQTTQLTACRRGFCVDGFAHCVQAPEQPAGYENAMTTLYSRNAAPKPSRRAARTLPQVWSTVRLDLLHLVILLPQSWPSFTICKLLRLW